MKICSLRIEIRTAEDNLKSRRARVFRDIETECEDLRMEIDRLELISFDLRQLFIYLSGKVKRYRSLKRLNYLENDTGSEVNKRLGNMLSSLEFLRHKLHYLENNTDVEVENRLSGLVSKLNELQKLKQTNEYKGALGELAVIKKLCKLSNEYYLFNDIRLELDDYIQFNGSSLRSAQIDHLVVGPTGVYVIETKNWSEKYIRSVFDDGSYTPYDQIQRSSYLAYRYLNENKYGNALRKIYSNLAGDEVKVRSIIAIAGSSIPFKKHRFIKVLSHTVITSHIVGGGRVLSPRSVEKIADRFIDI